MKKISLSDNDINSSPPLSNSLESFRFKDEDNYDVRFDSKFISVFSKYRLPRKLHFTIIFTGKVSTVIFSEGGYALFRLPNDKTSNF